MQLKKINESHYVVVTDEPINFNDYYLSCLSNRVLQRTEKMDIVEVNDKKITHSTQPLNTKFNDWFDVKMLDLSYIKSLVGEVDVEKKAEHHYDMMYLMEKNDNIKPYVIRDYSIGYNQCLEDNKDKRFSEEDMRKVIEYILKSSTPFHIDYSKLISSLTKPKDTWEVEFDSDNNLKLK